MAYSVLKAFYDEMESKKYPINAIFIFVYNDYSTYTDDPHLEECFDDEEVHEIIDSVSDLFEETLSFGSEKSFIEWCATYQSYKKVYVSYAPAKLYQGSGINH